MAYTTLETELLVSVKVAESLNDMRLCFEQQHRARQAEVLQVYLWDHRGGSAPRTKLGMGSGFSMNCLQLSEDANVLLVGTQTGDVSTSAYQCA